MPLVLTTETLPGNAAWTPQGGSWQFGVGPAGSGMPYTSIQAAIDAAVAAGASASAPVVVPILTSTYTEDVAVPDGISLQGFPMAPVSGPKVIGTGGLVPTITVTLTAPPVPPIGNGASLQGLTIFNPTPGGVALHVTGTADDVLCLVNNCLITGGGAGARVVFDVSGAGPQLIMQNVPVIGDGTPVSIGVNVLVGQLLANNAVYDEIPVGIHVAAGATMIVSELLFGGAGPSAPVIDAGGSGLLTDCDIGSPMTVNGMVTVADIRIIGPASPAFVGTGSLVIAGDIAFAGGSPGGFAPTLTLLRPFGTGPWAVQQSTVKTPADSPYAATGQEGFIGGDTTLGPITVDLPPLASVRGQRIPVANTVASVFTVSVTPAGGETIFGAAFHPLGSFTGATFYAPETGTDWWVI